MNKLCRKLWIRRASLGHLAAARRAKNECGRGWLEHDVDVVKDNLALHLLQAAKKEVHLKLISHPDDTFMHSANHFNLRQNFEFACPNGNINVPRAAGSST